MTLILKHANKNRLGAIDWGQTTLMYAKATAASDAYSSRRNHRLIAVGYGQ
jgi:hypothetical protein